MIIDTGSQCVYHSERSGSKIKEKLIWTPPRVVLQTVTGEKIDIHGKLKVKIKFGDTTYQHAVYVADIADPFILGLDFLKGAWFHSRLQQERITFPTRRSHYIQN
ncbi:gag-Pol polyprotein [Trichonephila clavipes]|nr:gag-Pol polyprotein [Trichonephila clavipes]